MNKCISKFVKSLITVLIFSLSFLKTFSAVNSVQLKSYAEFRRYAIHWGSNQMTTELNRALKHLQMIHGDKFNPYSSHPKKLVEEMKTKSYLDLNIYINLKHDPVEWHNKTLRSISYPTANVERYTDHLEYPITFISKGLSPEEDPYVKLYAIQQCLQRHKKIPIKVLLGSIFAEKDFQFLDYYIKVLRNKNFYKRIPKNAVIKVSKVFKKRIKIFADKAKTRKAKANALFLNILFSDYMPPLEIQTLMFLMDNEYPREFLVKVFAQYPSRYLEKFSVPFTKGYGNQFGTLLYLFEKFHSNRVLLTALKIALENRHERHFVFHQGAILNTWQRITSLEYKGDDKIYLDWYQSRYRK